VPPPIPGFTVRYDWFVRPTARIATYGRVRGLIAKNSGTKIGWQYQRRHGWLKGWRIVLSGDDWKGVTGSQFAAVLKRCRFEWVFLVELAIDFAPGMGVDRQFVRRHALFGKSRRDAERGGPGQLRYGGRHSGKLVRCYFKESVGAYRVELELHPRVLRPRDACRGASVSDFAYSLCPKHLRFVDFQWTTLKSHLRSKFGERAGEILAGTRERSRVSIRAALRYLRKVGVHNPHRFLRRLAINKQIQTALSRWATTFYGDLNQTMHGGDNQKCNLTRNYGKKR
jgi:hypothetical protein